MSIWRLKVNGLKLMKKNLRFDDANVSPASLQNVLATSAYVLFYEITRQSRDELLARYFMFSSVLRRVSDPDPDRIHIQSGQWIRIRIRNPDPDPGGQK
jgi:hypothetical protein